ALSRAGGDGVAQRVLSMAVRDSFGVEKCGFAARIGRGASRARRASRCRAQARKLARLRPPSSAGLKKARVAVSMVLLGPAFGGEVGSSNAVWADQRARPSFAES